MDRNPDDLTPEYELDHDFTPRRSGRAGWLGKARLADGAGGAIEVMIHNLSNSGFMAECTQPVLIGSYVSLDLPGIGQVEAHVRWQIGRRMGCMFMEPIPLARCQWVTESSEG